MNVNRLRYFCAVAEELHFGRAATRLHMAQPPLSQQIRLLEEQLGLPLFERTTRKVSLTAAGRELYVEALRVLAEYDRFEQRVKEVKSGTRGTLRIGFVDSASYDTMPRLLKAYRSRWPTVEYELRSMSSDEQIAALNQNRIDLGLSRTAGSHAGAHDSIEALVLQRERLAVAVPADNPLADEETAALAQLDGATFIGFDREVSPSLHRELAGLLKGRGIDYEPVIEATEYATILGLVASGQGIALIPNSVRTLRPPNLTFLSIDDDDATIPLLLMTRRDEASPLVAQVRDLANELFGVQQTASAPPTS